MAPPVVIPFNSLKLTKNKKKLGSFGSIVPLSLEPLAPPPPAALVFEPPETLNNYIMSSTRRQRPLLEKVSSNIEFGIIRYFVREIER